jgi:GGDEF domain-containing protein
MGQEVGGAPASAPGPNAAGGPLRLGIARKMLLGYGLLSGLIFLIALVSLGSLDRINRLNASILGADLPLAEAMERMIDATLDQELAARRAAILRDAGMQRIFQERSAEFDVLLAKARSLPESAWVPFGRLATLHANYTHDFLEALSGSEAPAPDGSTSRDGQIRETQEELVGLLKEVATRSRKNQNERTALTARLGARAFWVMVVFCAAGVVLSATATAVLTRVIAGPLSTLKRATERVSNGDYEHLPEVTSRDELGDLSRAFAEMVRRVRRMEELYLDASPLTRLPGSIALENVLRKRIEAGGPLAFCLVDLDNFKAYNDRYGYARGSELIKETARIVEAAAARHGAPDDFVGHIGGDDFAVVTSPERFRAICAEVIERFDEAVRRHFDPEDLARGFIRSKNRQGGEQTFPVTSVSIAVVTNIEGRLENPIQIGEKAAELKEYAKTIPGSNYVVDRRRKEDDSRREAAAAAASGSA